MNHKEKRCNELAEKWLYGTITEDEKKEFNEWYSDEEMTLNIPAKFAQSEKELHKRMLTAITQQKNESAKIVSFQKSLLLKLAAASIVILLCSISLYSYFHQKKQTDTIVKTEIRNLKQDISPGGNKAILVLADGTKVILDTAMNGTIARDMGTSMVKLNNGLLACTSGKGNNIKVGYNTLSTPRGGQYAITLADGTRVWMNSASSLRFPGAFIGSEREVEVNGEAYFEVAKDRSHPFRVKVNGMNVQVLGTHFNIMAYDDEEMIKTTLLEGSVRIHNNNTMALLKPGQQAQVGSGGQIMIKKDVNVKEAIAWKNGLFNFEGAGIEKIMRQMSRWYNIEVEFKVKITDHFTGTISKNVGIQKVFDMIEYTGAVHFIIKGTKVIVIP